MKTKKFVYVVGQDSAIESDSIKSVYYNLEEGLLKEVDYLKKEGLSIDYVLNYELKGYKTVKYKGELKNWQIGDEHVAIFYTTKHGFQGHYTFFKKEII